MAQPSLRTFFAGPVGLVVLLVAGARLTAILISAVLRRRTTNTFLVIKLWYWSRSYIMRVINTILAAVCACCFFESSWRAVEAQ